jgi:hypothetical protein
LFVKRILAFGVLVAFVVGARAESPPNLPFTSVDWAATMKQEPTKGVTLGHFRIEFERTTLADAERAVSFGTVGQKGDAGEHALWLCYTVHSPAPPGKIWIISDGEMGGATHVVTGITVARSVNATPSADCPALPPAMQPVHFDAPIWLNSTDAQIEAALGRPSHVQGTWRAYDFQTKVRGDGHCEGGYDFLSWVFTNSDSGKVTSIFAGQVTSC